MKINHITILVKNSQKALEFYKNKLGLEAFVSDDKHCWAKVGDLYIHLAQNSGNPPANSFQHFCIATPNLDDYLKELETKNVVVGKKDGQYFINDIDGNLIELIDENNKFFNPEQE